ncbi:type I-B CRISPR-associated protein Cas8b1/Cst1 [soil metagenome]
MNVETEPIWFTTGNPFVDAGQEMMAALAKVDHISELTKKDVRPLIERLISIYMQEDWRRNMHTIFPMSVLASPSYPNPKEPYSALLSEWFALLDSDESLGIPCAISGTPAHVYLSKTFLPMSDSVGYNFQSASQKGTPVSIPISIALQFFPLALTKIGKMWGLPHFSNAAAQAKWADGIVRNIEFSEGTGTSSVVNIGTSKQVNAFFRLIERLVRDQRYFPPSSITLYVFNNFNKTDHNVTVTDIHYMPSRVFGFIQGAMSPSAGDSWRKIVWRGYPLNRKIEDEEDGLRRFNNSVYWNLLNDRSISSFFVDRRKRCPVARGNSGWKLYSNYLEEVRGMDRTRIENLRELGDRIAPIVRDRKRRLLALEDSRSRGALTDVLYRIATKDSDGRLSEPLITFDQLITDLFPHDTEYSDWKEVKYLLLFRIYEQLFDDLKDDPEYINANAEGEESE